MIITIAITIVLRNALQPFLIVLSLVLDIIRFTFR